MRVDQETAEEKWIVEPTDILKHSDKGIDISFINIVLFVDFEILCKKYAFAGALSIVWSEVFVVRAREKVILHYVWEDTEKVILKLQNVLFNER